MTDDTMTEASCREMIRQHLGGKRGGRHERRASGLYTQAELAKLAGTPRSTLTTFLVGHDCYLGTMDRLLRALGYRLVIMPIAHDGEQCMT